MTKLTGQDVNNGVAASKRVEERKVGGGDATSSARKGASGVGVKGDRSTSADRDDKAGNLHGEESWRRELAAKGGREDVGEFGEDQVS
jgi:hypothetical protein